MRIVEPTLRNCEKNTSRRRNRLRHQSRCIVFNGGAGGAACPGRFGEFSSQLLSLPGPDSESKATYFSIGATLCTDRGAANSGCGRILAGSRLAGRLAAPRKSRLKRRLRAKLPAPLFTQARLAEYVTLDSQSAASAIEPTFLFLRSAGDLVAVFFGRGNAAFRRSLT
jgi:hypothetical protein